MLEQLRAKNSFPILPVTDPSFAAFGRLVEGDFAPLLAAAAATPLPAAGNVYVADEPSFAVLPEARRLAETVFGGLEVQLGYCNGQNTRLNCFEYHKSSEVDLAVTPLVLLLADLRGIRDNHLSTSAARAYFLPAGTAVELFATTLHFSPCRVSENGFRSVIVLPRGTNTPLAFARPEGAGEERLLWMTNKWLLSLPGTVQADRGAWVGLDGDNLEVCI